MNSNHRKALPLLVLHMVLSLALYHNTASVGTCSFHVYLYKTRMFCEVPFYQGLRMGLMTNCSDSFETLISCIKNLTRVCEYSWRRDAWIDLDVKLKFRKQFYCHNGALVVPVPLTLCGQNHKGKQCLRRFHAKFRNNISDTTLCEEYSNAKNCAQELLAKECPEHIHSRSYYMDVLFDDYNPFCKTILYNPPTTVTSPSRKTEGMVTSQRDEPSSSKSSPGAKAIVMNSVHAHSEKSSYLKVLKLLFVLNYLLLW